MKGMGVERSMGEWSVGFLDARREAMVAAGGKEKDKSKYRDPSLRSG
jgi:hypothetical protein